MHRLWLLHFALLPIALALFFFSCVFYSQTLYLEAASAGVVISPAGATLSQANASYANASAYVTMVNGSSYLIFYPNLSRSYAYLKTAGALIQSGASGASIEDSQQALYSAQAEYSRINSYRKVSLVIMLLITGILALVLYAYMKPVERKIQRKRRRPSK